MTLTFLPILPLWAVALVGIILLLLLAYGSVLLRKKSIPDRWVAMLGVVRVVAIVLFLLLLMRPVVNYTRSAVDKPNMLVMLDTSKSMGLDEAGSRDPRLRDALASLESSGLRDRLEQSFDVPWFAFDGDARPVDAGRVHSLAADGDAKDLARSIETAWNYHRLHAAGDARQGGEQSRLLLISDGNHQSNEDPVEVARRLGLTVYTLPPRDVPEAVAAPQVTIARVQGPASVLLGSEARFRARLRVEGEIARGPVELVLQSDGETVLTRQLNIDSEQGEQHVDVTHQPRSAGRKNYELQVRPAEGGPEFEPARPKSLSVNVLARSHQVLLLEDSWRWDFRFLRRVFEDDPNFVFTAFMSRRPGTYMQFAEPEAQVRLSGFPRSRGELEWFDTIILGDVNPSHWPAGLAPAIHEMVVERGKSLIVLAGPGLPRLAQVPQLRPLLPVEPRDTAGRTDGPVRIAPAPGARASSIFYTPEGEDFFAVFDDLPPMDQIYAPLRKRPAANLLLEAPEFSNEYGNLIVMAEHTVGRGRVLYLGTDTLWKWQMLASRDAQDRTPYRVFWQQTLRALSPQRPTDGVVNLWLNTDRSAYDTSQTVRLTAEVDAPQHDQRGAEVKATIELPDGRTLPAALRPDAMQAGVLVAEFQPPMPGTYTVTARMEVDEQTVAESVSQIHVEPRPDVLARRSNDTATLQRLATATGGHVISLDDHATWPSIREDEQRVVEVEHSLDLWRSSLLLVLLIGVLGFDWLVRLLRGFV